MSLLIVCVGSRQMRNGKKLLVTLAVLIVCGLPALAQERKGTITGTVKASGNSPLQSALVELLPSGRKVVTDNQGQFRITDVPASEYTLSVSYVGLAVSNVPVVVQGGQEVSANAVLHVASQADQVIVSGERLQGEAEAINIERMSEDIVQVLPAKVITSLPNTNIADAVGRLPSVTLERDEGEGKYVQIRGTEPRLSNTTMDGVNVPSPESGPRNVKLDVLLGGTYDHNDRGIDDVEPSQGTAALKNGTPIALVSGVDTRLYQYYRTRYGFAMGLDYRLSPGATAYLRGLYSDFHDFGTTTVYSYNAPTTPLTQSGGITTFDYSSGPSSDGSMAYRQYIRRPDQQIFSVLTGARHDLTSTLITYEFAVSRSHQIGGFPTTSINNAPANVEFNLDTTDPHRPKFLVQNGVNIFDPTAYSISEVQNVDLRATQLNFQGAASLARRYKLSSHLGTFEMGFKVRNAHKTYYVLNSYFGNSNPALTLATALSPFTDPNYYDKSYQYGPISDYNKLTNIFVSNPTAFSLKSSKTRLRSDPADYDTNERITAGYLMNSISFGKFRLQTELRFEATNSNYTANLVTTDPTTGDWVSTVPNPGSGSYLNVLPSVQLQYRLAPNTNLRATYGMGISRPNFSDIVPSVLANPNNSPPSVQVGNPALKATRGNDFDLLFEHFFQPLCILQAGFFYRALSNPMYNTTQTITSGPLFGLYPNYQLQQSINGPNAHITGFEAAWEQRLSRLPGLLSGLGVAAHYRNTTSQVSFPVGFGANNAQNIGRTDQPALLRQAPNTWNLGMTYDKRRFAMRFGVSHNDANIYAYNYQVADPTQVHDPILGLKGPTGDIYLYAHTQFDVQGSYRLYKGLRFVASGLNLSNEVFGFYQGSGIYPVQREYYKPSVILGMRWTSS